MSPPKDGAIINRGVAIHKVLSESFSSKISEGDLLVDINGTPLDRMDFSDAMSLLKTSSKSIDLTFECVCARLKHFGAPGLLEPVPFYSTIFHEHSMGFQLTSGSHFKIGGAMVKNIRGEADSVGVSVGDVLYRVNGTSVLQFELKHIQEILQATLPPRCLDFIPMHNISVATRRLSVHDNQAQTCMETLIQTHQATKVKEGVLYKGRRDGNAQQRGRGVLYMSKLEFYTDKSACPRGVVDFTSTRWAVSPIDGNGSGFVFDSGECEVSFSCDSVESQRAWLHAIQLAMLAVPFIPQSLSCLSTTKPSKTTSSIRIQVCSVQIISKPTFHSVNPYCDISVGGYQFQTPMIRNTLTPTWNHANVARFEVTKASAMIRISLFDERTLRGKKLLSAIAVPIASLPHGQLVKRVYPMINASITLLLEFTQASGSNQETLSMTPVQEMELQRLLHVNADGCNTCRDSVNNALSTAKKLISLKPR